MARELVEIKNMCDSFSWNDSNDMLCAIADEKFYSWVYPNAVFLEKEILDGSRYEKDASDIGKNCQILNFTGSFSISFPLIIKESINPIRRLNLIVPFEVLIINDKPSEVTILF